MSHNKYKSCIDACTACAAECEHCATACLHEQDIAMLVTCIQMNHFCADMCRTAAAFMARADEETQRWVIQACTLCAEICDSCANECQRHTSMDHCTTCAEACRKCAAECRAMGSM